MLHAMPCTDVVGRDLAEILWEDSEIALNREVPVEQT